MAERERIELLIGQKKEDVSEYSFVDVSVSSLKTIMRAINMAKTQGEVVKSMLVQIDYHDGTPQELMEVEDILIDYRDLDLIK